MMEQPHIDLPDRSPLRQELTALRSQLAQAEQERDEARRVAREMAGKLVRHHAEAQITKCLWCEAIAADEKFAHNPDCPVAAMEGWK